MISISSRSRFAAAASPLAVAIVLGGGQPALAQATQAANVGVTGAGDAGDGGAARDSGASPAAEDKNAIVVTGFRASLQNAINKKKKADQIVESVSAEDIGKLPDASIGEVDRAPARHRRAAHRRPRATSSRSAASARISRRPC